MGGGGEGSQSRLNWDRETTIYSKGTLMGSINDHRIDYMGGRGDSRKPVAHTQ